MAQSSAQKNMSAALSKDSKITALTLLKNFYDEEIFNLLVKEIYNADVAISEAAIHSSGSLGNEIAIPHLYQIIERGKPSQRISAIRALRAIRAPSSIGMLIKYFTHFSEEEVRVEILRAITSISPTAQQVLELNQAVYADPKQSETVKRIAVEAIVEAERYSILQETLTKASPGVQEAAFAKMLNSGSQEVIEFPPDALSPAALGCYLCLYTLKTKNPQANFVLEILQKGQRETILSFLGSLSQFQGRLRFPTRVFRLLLVIPYVDAETEALVGNFMKKIVTEVRSISPHLLSEFSVITSAHLDTVFAKVRKNFISLQGITNKEVLLATVLATILEQFATPSVLTDVQAFFKEDGSSSHTPPVAQMRSLMASAPKQEQNRFEACIPLFALSEKKDKLAVFAQLARVDLNRPFYTRRLNRLIRVAGALEIKTAAKKIQEILEFARTERIQFLEETSIVTLCQLLTRSIIELSREYFKEPTKNIRSLNGYIRGARFIPPKIMIGPLIHIAQHPALNPASRQLVVETLECMNLAGMQRLMPPLLKILDLKDVAEALKLRVGDLLARYADSTFAHQSLDLAVHATPAGRRVAIRVLRALAARGAGAPTDIVTNKLYLLLEDADHGVRVEALLALLAMSDDYATQIVSDYIQAGDSGMVADILKGMSKPLTREAFAMALDMIQLDNQAVQEELRTLLPELSQGTYSEELRQDLLSSLTVVPTDGLKMEKSVRGESLSAETESTLDQAKLEFKFRRESTQNLTVFFIDIVGYTEKSTTVGMTALLKLIKAFEDIVVSTVDDCQGRIVKKMGDGILAYFKSPVGAAVAALTVQKKIQDYSAMRVEQEKFQARIGLNTGAVIRKGKDILGEVVNVASRMQSAATPGDILLTESTYQEINEYVRCTELGRIQVKGIKEAITAYSPEELIADPSKLMDSAQEPGLQKLKESIFVPNFSIPEGKGNGEKVPLLLKQIFTEISRAIEELASDYHDEYEFKKYLQEKWNSLMNSL
jgi:class 3 adenylate cyclase